MMTPEICFVSAATLQHCGAKSGDVVAFPSYPETKDRRILDNSVQQPIKHLQVEEDISYSKSGKAKITLFSFKLCYSWKINHVQDGMRLGNTKHHRMSVFADFCLSPLRWRPAQISAHRILSRTSIRLDSVSFGSSQTSRLRLTATITANAPKRDHHQSLAAC